MTKFNEILKKKHILKLNESSCLSLNIYYCIFLFSFVANCLTPLTVNAELLTEQLDPTNLLYVKLDTISQDNTVLNTLILLNDQQSTSKDKSPSQDKTPVKLSPQDSIKSSQDNSISPKTQNSKLERQLWTDRISVPKNDNEHKANDELEQIIKQINSIEFKTENESVKPVIIIETQTGPNETLLQTDSPSKRKFEKIKTKLQPLIHTKNTQQTSTELLTEQTIKILETLSQQLEQLHNPFELAELLFQSGRLKEAAICYQEALKRSQASKDDTNKNKSWILFQIGNCLKDNDPLEAVKIYRQLIVEHPDSPWTDLAKAQNTLIDWYMQNKPKDLIEQCKL